MTDEMNVGAMRRMTLPNGRTTYLLNGRQVSETERLALQRDDQIIKMLATIERHLATIADKLDGK